MKAHLLQGKASYCKILGAAPPGYDNGPPEWTFDLILDEDGVKSYTDSGADPFYIKVNPDGNQFVKFKRRAQRKDGTDSTPIEVVGPDGKPWDQKVLIGNGSVLNVRFTLNEATYKKTTRLKPTVLGVQVWEHQKYIPKSAFPVKAIEDSTGEQAW